MKKIIIVAVFVCCNYIGALKLPGPLVYVVTPSPRPLQIDEGRAAPFYYQTWMKRMDSPENMTSTTPKPKVDTPDLIFAEFESEKGNNNGQSIRKLLEQERTRVKTSTTSAPMEPIYVPNEKPYILPNYLPDYKKQTTEEAKVDESKSHDEMSNYFDMYNSIYNNGPSLSTSTTPPSTTTTTASTTTPMNVENIWHIIDSEKQNQQSHWEEIPLGENENEVKKRPLNNDNEESPDFNNFALPGFATNPGNGAENESRAIRTEPNIRFPYVNLKPFQIKNMNKQMNSKKGNNMFNLDNFRNVKEPVRGEAQDFVYQRQQVDRYNPAQPYLPPVEYGSKSKQGIPETAPPVKSVANLVPPRPPPPPKVTANDFPAPSSYDSFPPYSPSAPDTNLPPPPSKPITAYQIPTDMNSEDSGPAPADDDDDSPPQTGLGYRYKHPSAPVQPFLPTAPPPNKPFKGYSYDKPIMTMDSLPQDDMPPKGYHYDRPNSGPPVADYAPTPDFDHHGPPSFSHDHNDYPELIFNKPHGGMDSNKGGDDTKENSMGMVPPPLPNAPDMGSNGDPGMPDDHGFPHDFPGDFKFHHDFDDHDFYHHHHHHPTTTTTTTTEMPRVNRYSYYYLGKKLYYLPLYFSVYFIVYVGALIVKAILRHKIVYPNSWRPNDQTSSFFTKRSIESWDLSNENLHEITGRVTHAIGKAAERYYNKKKLE